MRINVYGEEITDEVQVITKQAAGHDKPFYGIRLYLESPSVLTSGSEDDDRSAITFWIPQDQDGNPRFNNVGPVFDELMNALYAAQEQWQMREGVTE